MTELRRLCVPALIVALIVAVGEAVGEVLYQWRGIFQHLYNGGVDVGSIGQLIKKCASRTVITIKDPCYARGFNRAIGEDPVTDECLLHGYL